MNSPLDDISETEAEIPVVGADERSFTPVRPTFARVPQPLATVMSLPEVARLEQAVLPSEIAELAVAF